MYPIILPDLAQGEIKDLERKILEICSSHHKTNKAFVFGLFITDLESPQINKMLRDIDYMNALNKISGEYITLFYLLDSFVNEKITKASVSNSILLELSIQTINNTLGITPKELGRTILNKENITSPSILFFQVKESKIIDYIFAKINSQKIEESFIEIKNIIQKATLDLKNIKEENIENKSEIFSLIKDSIKSSNLINEVTAIQNRIIRIKDFLFFWKV